MIEGDIFYMMGTRFQPEVEEMTVFIIDCWSLLSFCKCHIEKIPVNIGQQHNHESDSHKLTADAFISNVKKRCCEEICPLLTYILTMRNLAN